MNRHENLGRELTTWFIDTATPRVPDFTDDILRLTAGTRQRPRWSFPERWLPMSVLTLGRQTLKPLPWRTIGLLAILALLLGAVAAYVGSQPRVPAPFGLAGSGLVAYTTGGDIYTVDPVTGAREAIVTGPEADREARWSLDGTRLAFLRDGGNRASLVVVDRQSRAVVATTVPLLDPDSDSIAWSPDGRSILVAHGVGVSRRLSVVEAATGGLTTLPIEFLGEASWRPPDGRQIVYVGGIEADKVLSIVNLADHKITDVVRPGKPDGFIRPTSWTPDGQRLVYMRADGIGSVITHVRDMATSAEVRFSDALWAHVSNDGSRMVALDQRDRLCMAELRGGPCSLIAIGTPGYDGPHAAGAQWSPDDEWILVRLASGNSAVVIRTDTGTLDEPSWMTHGGQSIQRVAP
jgi:Tol biopolymer transport system component